MANFRCSTRMRNALADAFKTQIDAGGAAGIARIYSGTQPAGGDTALGATNSLMATLTFAFASAPAAASSTLTFSAITEDTSADLTGTATWARVLSSSLDAIFDCDVSTSGATINLNTVAFVAGGPVRITSFTITTSAAG